jgi:hypothetical protein
MASSGESDLSGKMSTFPPSDLHRIRPDNKIVGRAATAAAAFIVPISVVMYVLTVPNGPWPFVLATELVVLVGLALAAWGVWRSGFWVGRSGIAERGFFGRTQYVPVSDIAAVILVETFDSDGVGLIPQLFLCDARGKQLVRMRGQFWSRHAMEFVINTLKITPRELAEPVTSAELLEEYPGLLYWFERHPTLLAVLFTTIVIVGGIVLYVALTLIGLLSPLN